MSAPREGVCSALFATGKLSQSRGGPSCQRGPVDPTNSQMSRARDFSLWWATDIDEWGKTRPGGLVIKPGLSHDEIEATDLHSPSKRLVLCLRDPASWLPLAAKASIRNLEQAARDLPFWGTLYVSLGPAAAVVISSPQNEPTSFVGPILIVFQELHHHCTVLALQRDGSFEGRDRVKAESEVSRQSWHVRCLLKSRRRLCESNNRNVCCRLVIPPMPCNCRRGS